MRCRQRLAPPCRDAAVCCHVHAAVCTRRHAPHAPPCELLGTSIDTMCQCAAVGDCLAMWDLRKNNVVPRATVIRRAATKHIRHALPNTGHAVGFPLLRDAVTMNLFPGTATTQCSREEETSCSAEHYELTTRRLQPNCKFRFR